MADDPEMSRTDDQESSDDETVKGEQETDHIADILEEELQAPSTPTPLGNGSIAHRYREIIKENEADAVSDNGSADAVPRRAGSPIDSLMSIPDDTPSIQVGRSCGDPLWKALNMSARAPAYPLPAAACSPRSPTGPAWAARRPPSGPSTADSNPVYTRHLSSLRDPPLLRSWAVTVGVFPSRASWCSTAAIPTPLRRLGKSYDGRNCGNSTSKPSPRLGRESSAHRHAWPCLPT